MSLIDTQPASERDGLRRLQAALTEARNAVASHPATWAAAALAAVRGDETALAPYLGVHGTGSRP